MYTRKAIIAIADGLGDHPCPELGGQTPLQAANTPHLDAVAAAGICGLMDPLAPGIPVGTDMGHLLLFGAAAADYPGRGPIEACGIGMPIEDGDVLFRCNFATVDENGLVLDRRAGRINEHTADLGAALNNTPVLDDIRAYFSPATEHRGVLILRGSGLSDRLGDTDPKDPQPGQHWKEAVPTDASPEAARTATALNIFLRAANAVLNKHPVNTERMRRGLPPANFLLTRGGGMFRRLPAIPAKYGFTGGCVAGEATVLGVARLMGYEVFTHPAFSANIHTDFQRKARLALEKAHDRDLVFVHVKATDLAGHDGLPHEKIKAIEAFDAMVGTILQSMPPNTCLGLTADHSTPCEVHEHSGDPVPIALCGPGIRTDRVNRFHELACAEGGLHRLTATDYFNTVLDYMGKSKKQGN